MVGSSSAEAEGTGTGAARTMELVLLIFVAVVVTAAVALVEADQQHQLSFPLLYLGAGFLVLFGAAHLAVRKLAPYADPLILPCVALLNGLGLVVIHRLDLADAAQAIHLGTPPSSPNAPKQIMWTALSLVLFIGVLWRLRDYRSLARYGYTTGMVGLVLLVLPGVLPASISEVNGAKLWLRLGPLQIQPGEFAKILVIIFAAAFLVAKRDLFVTAGKSLLGLELPRARDLAPLLVAWGLSVGVLALEKELGASLLFFGVVLVMIYVATERGSWLLIGLMFFVVGCVIAYYAFPHVRVRVEVWLDPFASYNTSGFQLAQSLFGLGTGGVLGTGLGLGHPEMVPFANTDFISATVGEELGLVGLMAVLLIYLVLATRGLRSALSVRDSFGKLLGSGLSFAMALQVFVVVGGVTRLIPLTGMTMPFLSYGGSSLLANSILVALLLKVSNAARQPARATQRPAPQTPLAEAHTEMVKRPQ